MQNHSCARPSILHLDVLRCGSEQFGGGERLRAARCTLQAFFFGICSSPLTAPSPVLGRVPDDHAKKSATNESAYLTFVLGTN